MYKSGSIEHDLLASVSLLEDNVREERRCAVASELREGILALPEGRACKGGVSVVNEQVWLKS
jgi:hypothetical protein